MDRRRRRSGALALAACLGVGAAALAEGPLPLRAVGWTNPKADVAAVLTTEPTECYAPTDALRAPAEIGRAAFRTPVLLGGQAARAGLSCESCHRGGRGNPEFLFPGVSGAPGTADVTSSLFSSHRGNGRDDPVPIPDLSGERARLKVAPQSLEAFIHGLVVEEFDGREPAPAVLTGLADYVRSLQPQACPPSATRPVSVSGLLDDVDRATAAAVSAPDEATRLLMIAGARARLGLIDERFAGPAFAAERHALRAADAELAAIAGAVRSRRPEARQRLAAWRERLSPLGLQLGRREGQSLFDPKTLRTAVEGRLPEGAS
ncbi:hypothetical protein [Phenylobacterium sp.]|uniref:hypothetical protein n=1 Tax=Phenylobacterium sp. TaxID=1871053 RepID=UPI0025E4B2AE|nr:hypothetical protein [Phenylobacterium sp.]